MKKFYYGIKQQATGEVTIFARNKKVNNATIIRTCRTSSREEALCLAEEIRLQYEETHIETYNYSLDFSSGDVVIYADRYGQHTAIVLLPQEYRSHFVFVTSNPFWGRTAREISQDEQALLGYPDRGRTSFFVPVFRENKFVISTGKTYPEYRIRDLIKEFIYE